MALPKPSALARLPMPMVPATGDATQIVEPCRSCRGQCCQHMGSPPVYAVYFPPGGELPMWARHEWRMKPGDPVANSLAEDEDLKRVRDMPAVVRAELEAYYALRRLEFETRRVTGDDSRHPDDGPCFWLDPETAACKHHEWRPSVCRDFEADGFWCRSHRGLVGPDEQPDEGE